MAGLKHLAIVAAFSVMSLPASMVYAQCTSGCDSCSAINSNFTYPGNCCGKSGCLQNAKYHLHDFCSECCRDWERNKAWPKPFACWDRMTYFSFWQAPYDTGWQVAYTLTEGHFDSETNELNHAGRAKVASIMQTAPQHRRSIYVYESNDPELNDARMASIRTTVDQWYGNLGETHIATSRILPQETSGRYIEVINQRFVESLPQPGIPVDVGQTISTATN